MAAKFFAAATVAVLLSVATSQLGCAPTVRPVTDKSGLEKFRNLDEPTLKNTGLGLAGQGRILFDQALSGISSNEHYVLEMNNWQDEGYFVLHSHLNGFQLMDGVQIEAYRHGNSIEFSMSTPGYLRRPIYVLENVFASVDLIRLRLEVHDGGVDGVRLLIWQDSISYQGELLAQLPIVTEANANFDSKEARLIFLSHGHGMRWGLQLVNVSLLKAFREVPYVN